MGTFKAERRPARKRVNPRTGMLLFPRILSAWRAQHWRVPDLEERRNPEVTVLFLSLASLMTDETIADLDERIGPAFRTLSEAARLVLASTLAEGVTTHEYLKSVTGLHAFDLTHLLRELKFQGYLVPEGKGRGMRYRLASPHHLPENSHHLPEISHHLAGSSHHLFENAQSAAEEDPTPWEALEQIAGAARASGKLPRAQLENLILELCQNQFLSLQDLCRLLDRKPPTLRNHYLTHMVGDGRLEMKFADRPAHPQQAYRARQHP